VSSRDWWLAPGMPAREVATSSSSATRPSMSLTQKRLLWALCAGHVSGMDGWSQLSLPDVPLPLITCPEGLLALAWTLSDGMAWPAPVLTSGALRSQLLSERPWVGQE
jgi:hypothetical protein